MPKYKFPLENQDDYRGVIYFTQIIETPPSIDTSAFERQTDEQGSLIDFAVDLGNLVGSSFTSGSVARGDTVQLYLPAAMAVQDGVEFDNFSFGVGGEAARQGLASGQNSVIGAGLAAATGAGGIGQILSNLNSPDIARAAAAGATKKFGGATAGAVTSSVTQTSINPNIRAVFKTVKPREHAFSFKFLPRSQREAQEIGNIIKWFRTEIYPEPIKINANGRTLPVGYKFPNKVGVRMKYNNKDIGAQLLPCYIRDMTTNYNATTMSFYRDGEFSEIDLTLSLMEYRTLDKDDIEYGFNVYGRNYKDLWEEFFSDIRSASAG